MAKHIQVIIKIIRRTTHISWHATREDAILTAIIYVNILIASQDLNWIKEIKNVLAKDFEIKDFGFLAKYCLGFKVIQMVSSLYCIETKTLLKHFSMSECKRASIPSKIDVKLEDRKHILEYAYWSRKSTLSWDGWNYNVPNYRKLIRHSTVAKLVQFSTCHDEKHCSAAKRILRYLRGTINFVLVYWKTGGTLIGFFYANWMRSFSDADWGGSSVIFWILFHTG